MGQTATTLKNSISRMCHDDLDAKTITGHVEIEAIGNLTTDELVSIVQ